MSAALRVRVAASCAERDAHMAVRRRVFVDEQRLFAETDRDAWDDTAVHAVALAGDAIVGAVRFYAIDEAGLWKGDRLAVLPEARRLRPGAALVRFAVDTAGALGGARMIAQIQVRNTPFFARLGWEPVGAPLPYRGVLHQQMAIALSGAAPAPAPELYAWALG